MALVILDRDGVINHDAKRHIRSADAWHPIAGSLEAVARLNHAGFRVVIATNQSGIARKFFDIEALNNIHQKMHAQLAEIGGRIDAIFFCPHRDKDLCTCRKPKPGLLTDIADRLHIPLSAVPVIGDSLSDIQAAQVVDARPILVRTGNGAKTLVANPELTVECHNDLASAVEMLIAESAALREQATR